MGLCVRIYASERPKCVQTNQNKWHRSRSLFDELKLQAAHSTKDNETYTLRRAHLPRQITGFLEVMLHLYVFLFSFFLLFAARFGSHRYTCADRFDRCRLARREYGAQHKPLSRARAAGKPASLVSISSTDFYYHLRCRAGGDSQTERAGAREKPPNRLMYCKINR